MWASVPEMFDCTEWDKISAISPLAAASSLQVIYKWGDFETKYTHNPVKTDPGTDIDTPSNSDDGATHTGCALEVASYAQNLLLIWYYFHPTLKQKNDGWKCMHIHKCFL